MPSTFYKYKAEERSGDQDIYRRVLQNSAPGNVWLKGEVRQFSSKVMEISLDERN